MTQISLLSDSDYARALLVLPCQRTLDALCQHQQLCMCILIERTAVAQLRTSVSNLTSSLTARVFAASLHAAHPRRSFSAVQLSLSPRGSRPVGARSLCVNSRLHSANLLSQLSLIITFSCKQAFSTTNSRRQSQNASLCVSRATPVARAAEIWIAQQQQAAKSACLLSAIAVLLLIPGSSLALEGNQVTASPCIYASLQVHMVDQSAL